MKSINFKFKADKAQQGKFDASPLKKNEKIVDGIKVMVTIIISNCL